MPSDKEQVFVLANVDAEHRAVELSPSGRYRLIITPYRTRPGSWHFTRGVVLRAAELSVLAPSADERPIADVKRNYGEFPFLWIEGHPNGHDYLVCGEDYQGQTVVELDTAVRRDSMSGGASAGVGFCWADYRFDPGAQILVVCGCFWGCPYEFRFFDFSDPMAGWPELALVDGEGESDFVEDDSRWPEVGPDGSVRCFQTLADEDDEEQRAERSIKTFKRAGGRLALEGEWLSDAEKEARRDQQEKERQSAQWWADFKKLDPLYCAYAELVVDPALSPEDYESRGWTYPGWSPDWNGSEKRFCRRIVSRHHWLSIDLEWAVDSGPIKLLVYKGGDDVETQFFEHSIAGMQSAFAYAKQAARGG